MCSNKDKKMTQDTKKQGDSTKKIEIPPTPKMPEKMIFEHTDPDKYKNNKS